MQEPIHKAVAVVVRRGPVPKMLMFDHPLFGPVAQMIVHRFR